MVTREHKLKGGPLDGCTISIPMDDEIPELWPVVESSHPDLQHVYAMSQSDTMQYVRSERKYRHLKLVMWGNYVF